MLTIEQREALAAFAGLGCRCEFRQGDFTYWGSCPMHSNGGQPPDYDRDEVAMVLLDVLAEKSYRYCLVYEGDQNRMAIWRDEPLDRTIDFATDSIAASICEAVLALIEEER